MAGADYDERKKDKGMISKFVVEALEQFVPAENIHLDESMALHTTFRAGGPADCFIEISQANQLQEIQNYLQKVDIPYFILGNGSNLLVSDKGYRGVVLEICNKMNEITVSGNKITAKAGAMMSKVANVAAQNGLTGMEFASGIPGTVGGGVVMNAGAYGGEMSQVVETVTVVNKEGEMLTLNNQEMDFGYRHSMIKNKPFTVVEVTYVLREGEESQIRGQMEELNKKRREKQPLEYPSAGSTFKRPEGYFAGELIMKSDLAGFSVGGAQVSEKHCGFIINKGNATAGEIMELIGIVQKKVMEKFQVSLEPEVIFLGEF